MAYNRNKSKILKVTTSKKGAYLRLALARFCLKPILVQLLYKVLQHLRCLLDEKEVISRVTADCNLPGRMLPPTLQMR